MVPILKAKKRCDFVTELLEDFILFRTKGYLLSNVIALALVLVFRLARAVCCKQFKTRRQVINAHDVTYNCQLAKTKQQED